MDEIADALAPLPPAALRIGDETARALHHLGIETIGQLMRLPREALPARFGPGLLQRLDQALGNLAEPLVPLEALAPIEARMDFDGVVDSLEAVWIAFKQLITKVVAELLRRGRGARRLEVEFVRPYAPMIRKTIRLSRPSRDPANLFNLLRCAMESLKDDGKEAGFLGIRLIVALSERIADEQIQLLEHEEFAAEIELSRLIERLRIRLGEAAVAQAEAVESYLPERAWCVRHQGAKARRHEGAERARPLHLWAPEEIGVIVTPSHDRDGRPVSFTWRRGAHRIAHAVGPERIAGQWWQGHRKTRDYFDVEDTAGRRFWVFRVMETGKWYLQGEYE